MKRAETSTPWVMAVPAPQLPMLTGRQMHKEELRDHFMSSLGVGYAPLPDWGCPEGLDAYMKRLSRYVTTLADYRGCSPGDLSLPLGANSPDEVLIFGVLLGGT